LFFGLKLYQLFHASLRVFLAKVLELRESKNLKRYEAYRGSSKREVLLCASLFYIYQEEDWRDSWEIDYEPKE
jgi:hypothetical protein